MKERICWVYIAQSGYVHESYNWMGFGEAIRFFNERRIRGRIGKGENIVAGTPEKGKFSIAFHVCAWNKVITNEFKVTSATMYIPAASCTQLNIGRHPKYC